MRAQNIRWKPELVERRKCKFHCWLLVKVFVPQLLAFVCLQMALAVALWCGHSGFPVPKVGEKLCEFCSPQIKVHKILKFSLKYLRDSDAESPRKIALFRWNGQGAEVKGRWKTGRGISFCGFPSPPPPPPPRPPYPARATVRKIAAQSPAMVAPPPRTELRPSQVLRKCAVSEVPTWEI